MKKWIQTMENELAKALRELCDYIGGSDIRDRNHPIYKAHKVLERFERSKKPVPPGGKSA